MVAKPKKQPLALTLLDKLFVGVLLVIFGGIVLHAPLSVGLGVLFPDFSLLIKSWKEVLMLLAGLLLAPILFQKQRWDLLRSPIVVLISVYAALHLVLLPVFPQGLLAALAGLSIDLRYLLYFVLVFVAISLYPQFRRPFIVTFFAGAFIVATFALLQVFVLPPDILKYIGYSTATIVPYLTVDQNMDYIRISSTLRGPNPLGAYAGIAIALLAAFWLRANYAAGRGKSIAISFMTIGSVVALWASYSRSALIGAAVAIAIVCVIAFGRKIRRRTWIVLSIIGLVLAGVLFAARDTPFVTNVILHDNPTTGAEITSNDGHAESLKDGLDRMLRQPLGAGVGSTGSASLYSEEPLVIENQYLFIAHESGWIGFGLFLLITFMVLRELWRRRADWLALGVFASGIGLIVIGILLPVLVDDTVSIIWWGLAAIAFATKGKRSA
jgi:hypothetical protein